MNSSKKQGYFEKDRHHIGQGTQMAERAFMNEIALGTEMAVVVNVIRAIETIEHSNLFRHRVVVEGDGKQHRHINRQQQPCKLLSSIAKISHCPKTFFATTFLKGLTIVESKKTLLENLSKNNIFCNTTKVPDRLKRC